MADITLEHLTISYAEIPCEKMFTLGGVEYAIEFHYNDVGDFFTFVVKDYDGGVIYAGKFSYLRDALNVTVPNLPSVKLIPVSMKEFDTLSYVHDRIDKNNFDAIRVCVI